MSEFLIRLKPISPIIKHISHVNWKSLFILHYNLVHTCQQFTLYREAPVSLEGHLRFNASLCETIFMRRYYP